MKIKTVRRRRVARAPSEVMIPPARRTAPAIPNPPHVQPVAITGLFVDSVSVIPKTVSTLHVLPGRLEVEHSEMKSKVLVPFAEIRLGGGPIGDLAARDQNQEKTENEKDLPTIFSQSLTLENLAFVILDLTSDLRRMCREVSELAQGTLAVDPARMAVVRYYVAHLERQARQCRLRLDATYGVPEAPS